MKKVIIYSIIWMLFLYATSAFRCLTFDPIAWGWGTRTFFSLLSGVGILGFIGFANEDYKNLSHWAIFIVIVVISTFIVFEVVYPAITQPMAGDRDYSGYGAFSGTRFR